MNKSEAAKVLSDPQASSARKTEAAHVLSDTPSDNPMYLRNDSNDWTKDEEDDLRELAKQNTPTRVIGLKLGRSENAVYAKASSLGVSLKPTNQSPAGGDDSIK